MLLMKVVAIFVLLSGASAQAPCVKETFQFGFENQPHWHVDTAVDREIVSDVGADGSVLQIGDLHGAEQQYVRFDVSSHPNLTNKGAIETVSVHVQAEIMDVAMSDLPIIVRGWGGSLGGNCTDDGATWDSGIEHGLFEVVFHSEGVVPGMAANGEIRVIRQNGSYITLATWEQDQFYKIAVAIDYAENEIDVTVYNNQGAEIGSAKKVETRGLKVVHQLCQVTLGGQAKIHFAYFDEFELAGCKDPELVVSGTHAPDQCPTCECATEKPAPVCDAKPTPHKCATDPPAYQTPPNKACPTCSGAGPDKVQICHGPKNKKLCVTEYQLPAFLANGDSLASSDASSPMTCDCVLHGQINN